MRGEFSDAVPAGASAWLFGVCDAGETMTDDGYDLKEWG